MLVRNKEHNICVWSLTQSILLGIQSSLVCSSLVRMKTQSHMNSLWNSDIQRIASNSTIHHLRSKNQTSWPQIPFIHSIHLVQTDMDMKCLNRVTKVQTSSPSQPENTKSRRMWPHHFLQLLLHFSLSQPCSSSYLFSLSPSLFPSHLFLWLFHSYRISDSDRNSWTCVTNVLQPRRFPSAVHSDNSSSPLCVKIGLILKLQLQ